MRVYVIVAVLAAACVLGHAATALADDNGASCLQAIEANGQGSTLPPGLLRAIATVESGRSDPRTGRVSPWPWTINVRGSSQFFATKAEAIEAVQRYLAAGESSIDVGCMQISLRHHPNVFASLEEAFDPAANVDFAIRFLRSLFRQSSAWPQTVAAYHSLTPEIGAEYWGRVMAQWPLAARFGGRAQEPLGSPAFEANPNRMPGFDAFIRDSIEDHRRNLANVRGGLAPRAELMQDQNRRS